MKMSVRVVDLASPDQMGPQWSIRLPDRRICADMLIYIVGVLLPPLGRSMHEKKQSENFRFFR
jgi:hypothetical protein